MNAAERNGFTRSEFLCRSAVAFGALTAAQLTHVTQALALSAEPKPIPGGFNAKLALVASNPLVHVFPPHKGRELSTITDFNGFVAAAQIQGLANGSDGTTYSFDCDMRFMQGVFRDTEGRMHQGAFALV